MARELYGSRYLTSESEPLKDFIVNDLPYLDFPETMEFYDHFTNDTLRKMPQDIADKSRALLDANDRYYLLTVTCHRPDAWHPWIFERCREVEAAPDGFLDLWARYHYKSTICTFAGSIQEIIRDPEITIAIMSCTNQIAEPFLVQIQQELESNEDLKRIHSDVFWAEPKKEAKRWSRKTGIVVKRRGNPKEATVESFGIIDGMRTGKHYGLLNYDDLVVETMIDNPEMIQKVTQRWELSDSLGPTHGKTRKWHQGTRYSFGDTYGVLLERGIMKERRHPATDDGKLTGTPVLLDKEKWADVKLAQRSTVNAQMLLNPLAGNESTFSLSSLKHYDVIPAIMNVYIIVDPSMGNTKRSDRTGLAVIGYDVGGNKYLLDGYCHRMKLSRRYELMCQLKKKWENHYGVQIVEVGYERYGMQVDLEVIKEYQERDKNWFEIKELNTTKDGTHSKNDRISRLEPDINRGRFYVPATVYHADYAGKHNMAALWDVQTEESMKKQEDEGVENVQPTETVMYRPMQGPTRQQRYMEATGQAYRIITPLRRRNEDGDIYDLTRILLEELKFHPFAAHDDLIDAVSRIYDMEPSKPIAFEALAAEATAHPDA